MKLTVHGTVYPARFTPASPHNAKTEQCVGIETGTPVSQAFCRMKWQGQKGDRCNKQMSQQGKPMQRVGISKERYMEKGYFLGDYYLFYNVKGAGVFRECLNSCLFPTK